MNQNDLVAAVAKQLQQTQKQVDAALTAALAVIAGSLANYPMTAPDYAKARLELAVKIGLGRNTKSAAVQ